MEGQLLPEICKQQKKSFDANKKKNRKEKKEKSEQRLKPPLYREDLPKKNTNLAKSAREHCHAEEANYFR